MDLIFKLAHEDDFNDIMGLYRAAMSVEGCTWCEEYPNEEILHNDMSRKDIYCLVENNIIIGAISIDDDEIINQLDNWSTTLAPSKELARLVVKNTHQNRGIARFLLTSIMQIVKERGYKSVHFLVSQHNVRALRSYAKLGFSNVGEATMFGEEWFCYEKELLA